MCLKIGTTRIFPQVFGIGTYYQGCQTKTVSGKTCQPWSTGGYGQYAYGGVNGDVKMPIKHNKCRNFEGGAGIWCDMGQHESRMGSLIELLVQVLHR